MDCTARPSKGHSWGDIPLWGCAVCPPAHLALMRSWSLSAEPCR